MHIKVLNFWFEEAGKSRWWKKDPEFDRVITDRFSDIHEQARNCELYTWRKSAGGRLAEVIILDQFSRNIFRDLPESFAYDSLALALAQEAIASGSDRELSPTERSFLYMPYMHSESPPIHEIAVELFTANGIQNNLDFEMKHKAIIDRFGRYPHRNAILGRKSTTDETEFLKQPGSSF